MQSTSPMIAVVFRSDQHKDNVSAIQRHIAEASDLKGVLSSEIVYLGQRSVSIRIALHGKSAFRFLRTRAARANSLALFSSFLPFPVVDPGGMNSAVKLIIIQDTLDEILFHHCKIPRSADVSIIPFHDEKERVSLFRSCIGRFQFPIMRLRAYYGDEVMFYFAWFNHYNLWLCIPAIVGSITVVMNSYSHWTLDTNPMVPVFSWLTMIWAVVYVKMWERRSNEISLMCDISGDDTLREPQRRQFIGTRGTSPITGEPDFHYPEWRRVLKQPLSWAVTALFSALALFVQVCLLNLQGYMNSHKHELFEIAFFDEFSHPGRLLDPKGSLGTLAVVLHSLSILTFNDVYRHVAVHLTDWENYKTSVEHDESLTQKRISFEFINCFASLFYIAFYRLDMPLLRQELISLFLVDQVRRLLLESVLPFTWHALRRKSGSENRIEEELLPEYDAFEDYLEIVMQFGYITFFASAFPLAALLSLLGNLIEIRSDIFKFTYIFQRPYIRRTCNIGTWTKVLKGFAFLSVVSNALLFGFTSGQMKYYFPSLFDGSGHSVGEGDEPFVVATIFVIEHVALLFGLFLEWRIPSMPEHVKVEIERRRYRRLLAHKADLDQIR